MEMLHLRYFVAVAEELNFSAAARRLHMAASPLSQRIKDLEHELGQRLFDRSTHHVTLTPAGTALLPIARDVLDQVNAIPWRLREATGARRATVFLGMPAGVHPELRARVNTLAERVRERFELKRWPGTTPALVSAVREGKLALALARLPVGDPALDQLTVMTERLGAVVPADQFAGRDAVSLAELTELSYVATPAEITPAYFDQLDRELFERGIRKRIKLADTGYGGASEIISTGMAFSVSMLDPESPMSGYRLDNVTVLPFTDFRPRLDTGLVWQHDRAHGGDLDELVAAAREVFAEPLTR
ncbi:LysR family transcriptional regulator [Amycolatopsis magusensis]|uniref:DNA-binding transcriptional LysR family regulator n=1 Tax=Amycolatopsis magusensis TaxID=882444 RepID=A0ABS4Q3I0_9PSEU|nr:LysR family transcriptional regulator [Amycolatopsis magusensis]MBP2185675.1 DNA-binding transcriptional LysR family regulator [Amycolatopsis magusensis]MDI5980561.1 LysR family transcriptional regulator [Amycolatopsis magusensis]